MSEFQTATHENSAAIYSLRKTSNLLNIYKVLGALYLTQPENHATGSLAAERPMKVLWDGTMIPCYQLPTDSPLNSLVIGHCGCLGYHHLRLLSWDYRMNCLAVISLLCWLPIPWPPFIQATSRLGVLERKDFRNQMCRSPPPPPPPPPSKQNR